MKNKSQLNELNVPKLRFKGFCDSWQVESIESFSDIKCGKTPPTENCEYWNSKDVPFITPTDINSKYQKNSERHLSTKGALHSSTALPGSIFVTCVASIGKNSICKFKSCFNQQINNLLIKEYVNEFIYYSLEKNANFIKQHASTSATQIINKINFGKILIPVSPNLNEQQIIANFFALLDKQIELWERKLQLYELFLHQYKIFIFQKNCKMDNKLKLVDVLSESNKKISYKKIAQAVVGKKGIRLKHEVFLSQNQVKDNHQCKILSRNNLVIGMGSTQIDCYINLEHDNLGVSTAYRVFEFKKKLNYKYINYVIHHNNLYLSSKFMIIGARQGKSVDINGFLNYEFKLHDYNYQLLIVRNISKIDENIAFIKKKLNILKKNKLYYLLKMFI